MQVMVEQEVEDHRGGGDVFVARCGYEQVRLRWIDSETLEILYPAGTAIEDQKAQSFFYGRTIAVQYGEMQTEA